MTNEEKRTRYALDRSEKEEWTVLTACVRYGLPFLSSIQSCGVTQSTFSLPRASLVFGTLLDHTGASSPLDEESITHALDKALESKRAEFVSRKHKTENDRFLYGEATGESLAALLFWEPQYRATEESATFLAKSLVSKARFRAATRELRDLLGESQTWEGEPESFVEEVQRRVLGLPSPATTGEQVKKVSDYLPSILDRMWNDYHSGAEMGGLKTGYPILDKLTNGMRKSDLVILAAQSGVGKSAFATNVAVRLAKHGKKVLVFSLEMDLDEIVERMVWIESQIWSDRYWGKTMTDADWETVSQASASLCSQNISVVDDFSMTMTKIASIARHRAFTEGVDFIIVDYAQIIRMHENTKDRQGQENREAQVREIADALKRMVGEVGCPVMALAQLNDDNRVRESRALKFNASHLWILSVSETQEGLGELGAEGKLKRYELLIDKGRRSATGRSIPMLFFGSQTRLEEEAVEVMGEDSQW